MTGLTNFPRGLLAAACLGITAHCTAQSFDFSTLAGNAGYGTADGQGANARFDFPVGVAVDGAGNIYVTDTDNNTIRRIDSTGLVTTVAGIPGSAGRNDGIASQATFANPQGLTLDASGNIYVADTANHTIREINSAGIVSTVAGLPGVFGSSNGVNNGTLFNQPGGVAMDASGVLYVADTHNSTIRMLTPSGTNWIGTTIAGAAGVLGDVDGTNTSARFYWPAAIGVGTNGDLFVADDGNKAIRRIAPSGPNWITTTLAVVPVPGGVSVDHAGDIFVSASVGDTIREITGTGATLVQTTIAGIPGVAGRTDGSNVATFNQPLGVTVLTNGVVIVADSLNNIIRQITPDGVVSTLAGSAGGPGSADGLRTRARFSGPTGIAVDAATNAYVTDTQNNCIRRITPAGVVTTLVGAADNSAGSADGSGTNASFTLPAAVAVDAHTNIYVADFANNEIRKVALTSNSWTVTTLAGRAGTLYEGPVTNIVAGTTNISTVPVTTQQFYTNYSGLVTNIAGTTTNVLIIVTNTPIYTNSIDGSPQVVMLATNVFVLTSAPPYVDGVGTNALFYHPSAITIDNNGLLYVAENGTNGVRTIASDGTVATLAASVGAYSVSPVLFGTNQLPYYSSSVVVDPAGAVYVADAGNNTIRKISPSGQVITMAGSPGVSGTADGTNEQARFASPVSLILDSQTNLLVADSLNNTIRKIVPSGSNWVVTTVGGRPGVPGSTDGSNALFDNPSGIALDSAGDLYVADTGNNTIRLGQVGTAAPVSLQVSAVAGQIIISWPSAAVGYVLQVKPTASGGVWNSVTSVPTISGNYWVVTNGTQAGAAFYRLYKP